MTEQQQQQPAPGSQDETAPEVVEERPTPSETLAAVQDEVADRARTEYLAQTAKTRKDQPKRYAAYDRTFLRFIDGTTADSDAKAIAAAKALGHEGDHIETRPV